MLPPSSLSSRHISVLLVDPDRDFSRKVQALLLGHFSDALDLALTGSLHDGLTHLCTHQVRLILLGPVSSSRNMSDAVRALRLAAPNSGILAYGFTPDESFRFDALRAGAHEVFFIANSSPDTFRLTLECAMARSRQSATDPVIPVPSKLIHDLSNAITAINGFADILLNRLPADPQDRVCAEQIRKAGTRAADLITVLAPHTSSPQAMQQDNGTCEARAA